VEAQDAYSQQAETQRGHRNKHEVVARLKAGYQLATFAAVVKIQNRRWHVVNLERGCVAKKSAFGSEADRSVRTADVCRERLSSGNRDAKALAAPHVGPAPPSCNNNNKHQHHRRQRREQQQQQPPANSDVQVLHVEGIFLDELAARLYIFAHQGSEDGFSFRDIFQFDL
jgi:hypothetical protein